MKTQSYLIVTGDFVATGGMDRANLALARFLADREEHTDHVHLVAHRADEEIARHPRVTFHQVPRLLKSHWLSGPLLNVAARHQSRKHGPVRVVVNGGNCRTAHASINWVHYLHASWSPSDHRDFVPALPRRLKDALAHRQFLRNERDALGRARVIIANSRLTASQITEHYSIDPDRIRVVYYGTDTGRFSPVTVQERMAARTGLNLSPDRPVILFVGALGDARKGFDILFEAWREVSRRSDWDARLLVVGAGASLPIYRDLARSANLDESISFLGFRSDVPVILAAADLLVSPVRYEAYGLNVHEALCREVPVLVTAGSGIAERIPADSPECRQAPLILPAETDPESLAKALEDWRRKRDAYRLVARTVGAELREKSWDDRMAELVSHVECGLELTEVCQ